MGATRSFRRSLMGRGPSAPPEEPGVFVREYGWNLGGGSGPNWNAPDAAPPRFPSEVDPGDVALVMFSTGILGTVTVHSDGWTLLGEFTNTTNPSNSARPKAIFYTKTLDADDINDGINFDTSLNRVNILISVWRDIAPIVLADISKTNYNGIYNNAGANTIPPVADPGGLGPTDWVLRWWSSYQGDWFNSGAAAFGAGGGANKLPVSNGNGFVESGTYDSAPGASGLASFVHTPLSVPYGMRGAVILRAAT